MTALAPDSGCTSLGTRMRNLWHEIDPGTEEELRAAPRMVCCGYAGWNFFALVWFDGEQFVAGVDVFRERRGHIFASSLRDLMTKVCDQYGDD